MQRVQLSTVLDGEESTVAWGDASALSLTMSGTLVSSSRTESGGSVFATLATLAVFGIVTEWPMVFVLWAQRQSATTPQQVVGALVPALASLFVFTLWSAVRMRGTWRSAPR